MGSQLDSIVDTIATMSIAGFAMDVYWGDASVNNVDIANLPARIVNAVGFSSSMNKVHTFGSGHIMTTEWTITDITLMRKAGMVKEPPPGLKAMPWMPPVVATASEKEPKLPATVQAAPPEAGDPAL